MNALAYINFGRWVVDCPVPGCTDARQVEPPLMDDVCAHGHPIHALMPPPDQAAALMAELVRRPVEADRAWYPAGHPRALLAGLPTGQSVADLRAETVQVAQLRARQQDDRQQRLAVLLAELGVQVGADGAFSGSL